MEALTGLHFFTYKHMSLPLELSGRKTRKIWYADVQNGKVRHVTGYFSSHPEASQNHWWCPEIETTLTEGFGMIHETEDAARQVVEKALWENVERAYKQLKEHLTKKP